MSSLAVTLTKHSGLGNDFLVVEVPAEQVADWPANARALCNRTSGIGADGLLLLSKIDDSNLTMRLYNSDGSLAEMSGNGIRCLAQAAYMLYGHTGNVDYMVATDAGPRRVEVQRVNDTTINASVDMGLIGSLDEPANWNTLGTNPDRPVAHISVGNPHSVVGVEDVQVVPLKELGEKVPQVNLGNHRAWPGEQRHHHARARTWCGNYASMRHRCVCKCVGCCAMGLGACKGE
jgi:diaminopimelate epimerase